jgi:4-aminobutyrate aminotransferase/(S)-3-amino-2-methylpropionate transaminase
MEHFDVAADLTTAAKSLAAGMPLSAVVGRKELMDAVHPSGIGGTYGGNPVACAAALAVMDVIEEEYLIQRAQKLGDGLRSNLDTFKEEYEIVGDVRGLGPMMAMELVKDRESKVPASDEAKALANYCYDRGLILLTCGAFGNVVRLLMPLVISEEQLSKGLEILNDGLAAIPR